MKKKKLCSKENWEDTNFTNLWWPRPHRNKSPKPFCLSLCPETGPTHLSLPHKPLPFPHNTWVDSWLLLPFRKGTKVRGETVQSPRLWVTRSDRALEPSMGTWQRGGEDRQRTETIQGLQHQLHPSPEISTFRAFALG